jgi:hypothetical protein
MALKYVGDGTYFHNVPARDLSDKEEEKYGVTIAEEQAISGRTLYEKVKSSASDASTGKGGTKPDKE